MNLINSRTAEVQHGIPQGSINFGTCFIYPVHVTLGNISSVTTTPPSIATRTIHSCTCHFKSPDISKLASLHSPLDDIKDWMSRNFLKCNSDKTEVLIIGPEQVSEQIQMPSLLTISQLQQIWVLSWTVA